MNDFIRTLNDDISKVFLNLDEFASTHNIDGQEYNIIIDEYELNERNKGREKELIDGIHIRELLIYVSKDEFKRLPSIGRILFLDNAEYLVKDAQEEEGVFVITLEKNVH